MSDPGLSKFATSDMLCGLLEQGVSPRELVLRLGGTDDSAVATDMDFYAGFKQFLLNHYDYSKIFTEIADDIEQFVEVCPALAQTDVVTDFFLKVIESRNGFDPLTPDAFGKAVAILKQAPQAIQSFFVSTALSPRGITGNQAANAFYDKEKPFSPQTRLGIALTAALAEGFALDSSTVQERPRYPETRGDKYIASYSAQELSLVFKNAIPFKALPELLAVKAFNDYKSGGIKAKDYEHLFNPLSEELDGLHVERQSKLARRFMKYLGLKLASEYGRDEAASTLEKLFGQFVDANPRFNLEIRNSLTEHLPSPQR